MLGPKVEHAQWRRINYRSTKSLLAAEFLHGLYQRHDPLLNPIHFCNTLVAFRPWESSSYAPATEWDLLGLRFGARILRHPRRLEAEIRRILADPRRRSRVLATRLDAVDLAALTDVELLDLLLEVHHVPLGEIYRVNLVQVEHALHAALGALVDEACHADRAARDEVLARLVASAEPTCAAAEELRFQELIADCRARGITDPDTVADRLRQLVQRHHELGAAYGAETVSLEGMKHRFRQFVGCPEELLLARRAECGCSPTAEALLERLRDHSEVQRLASLLRLTGEVRDRNKRLLGRLTRHRGSLLEEIARRRKLPALAVRLYLLEELLRLLEDRLEVPETLISERFKRGVVLSRSEHASLLCPQGLPHLAGEPQTAETLTGLCAAPGRCQGLVRLVGSAADIERMHVGDVLVAKGTDFDLALLMSMAGAIVTEEGGLLSHAAVLARECGIPCLIEVAHATDVLAEGELVCVDASAGTVERIHSKPANPAAAPQRPSRAATVHHQLRPLEEALSQEECGCKAFWLATLARAGLPIPENGLVLPVRACAELWQESFSDSREAIESLAVFLCRRYGPQRLNLRSSSPLESRASHGGQSPFSPGTPPGRIGRSAARQGTVAGLSANAFPPSAAGVFQSAIALRPEVAAIIQGLRTVLGSAATQAARSYFGRDGQEELLPLAILATPFYAFCYQGTAVSQSVYDPQRVLLECFEGRVRERSPDRGGFRLAFRRDTQQTDGGATPGVPHLAADLAEVARLTLAVETQLGQPVEVEWGLRRHRPVILQARPLPLCCGRQ